MLAGLIGLTLAVGGGDTAEGIGDDEQACESIQDTAEDVENEL